MISRSLFIAALDGRDGTRHNYPAWICAPCGKLYGKRECGQATWHEGDECGVCGDVTDTTEPRDFGHLNNGWKSHKRAGK